MTLLEGKTALITGASRGIGKAIAVAFAKQGANIAFSDLNKDENMENVEKELQTLGVKATGFASDASSLQQSEKLVEDVLAEFGQIDILVNNAGITRDGLLMRMEEKDWDIIMAVNLKSVFNLTKAVQRTMLKQRSGSIINMSSVVGVDGNAGQSNYSASKAGADRLAFSYFVTYDLPVIITRCSNNYGPYQYPEKLIPLCLLNAIEGRPLPIYGDGRQQRDWLQ